MTYENILEERDQSILTIYINRPNKLNALNRKTLNELHLTITNALNDDQVSGIILTGAGNKAFVAGADISELANFNQDEGRDLAQDGQSKVFDIIQNASKPVIAAVNGFALGGGLELALACHMRVAADTAKMGLPEVSLGLIPGYGGTQRLTQLIGKGRALEMILTADMIDARKAFLYGLVNHVVVPEELLNKAKSILRTIAERSPRAVAAAIRSVNASLIDGEDGFQTEIKEFSASFGSPDFNEGIAAFLEKRKPIFRRQEK
jgi:enoyl-CoA hydratase